MYKKYSSTLKEEQRNINKKIKDVENIITNEENKIKLLKENEEKSKDIVKKFCNLENINSDVVNEFIEKISIDKNRDFHIKLKFDF